MATGITHSATHRGSTVTRTSQRTYTHTVWLHYDRRILRSLAVEQYRSYRRRNRANREKVASGMEPGQALSAIEEAKAWLAEDEAAKVAEIITLHDNAIAEHGETYWQPSGQFASTRELAAKAARSIQFRDPAVIGYEIVPVTRGAS